LHHGLRPFYLRGHLRDLKLGKQLSGAYPVPNIDIDLLDIAGNLGVNLDFLKGEELSRHFKPIRKRRARYVYHGRSGQGGRDRRLGSMAACAECSQQKQKA
jgi:hypothetical protein